MIIIGVKRKLIYGLVLKFKLPHHLPPFANFILWKTLVTDQLQIVDASMHQSHSLLSYIDQRASLLADWPKHYSMLPVEFVYKNKLLLAVIYPELAF